jgi:hypothetical protein
MQPLSPVLVHYHIFKNAGTSVDECLRESFGPRWGTFEGPHAHAIQSSDNLADFLSSNRQLRAVSSHLARPPLPGPHCLPIAFIRHPLLRAQSVYLFTRQDPSQPFSQEAQAYGFGDYLRWALREESGSIVIRDYQVVHLSDASWRCDHILNARATEADLDQACRMLDEWGMVGVVEAFDLSIAAYQALYGPSMAPLRLSRRWDNQTVQSPLTTDQRIDALRKQLGESLYSEFMAANRLDVALHEHAHSVLQAAALRLGLLRRVPAHGTRTPLALRVAGS